MSGFESRLVHWVASYRRDTMQEATTDRVRKHLYLITSHPDEDVIGLVECREQRYEMAEKNVERRVSKLNVETGESFGVLVVGLGYHDFESEQDYEGTFVDVVQDKLSEIDDEHLEKAGVEVSA